MAVQNPTNLYSGGQGIFNSMPYTQIALQQEAKKQAKQEALNQYFHEMRGKINEAGTRIQDIGGDGKTRGIKDDIAEWENHWKVNKDDILRGGTSQQKNDELYSNIQRRIEQSKQRAKFQLEQGKAVAEGKFDPDDEDIKGAMSHVSKSIYDPTSYKDDGVSEYGWGDLSPAIPDYDVEKKSKIYDAITKGVEAGKKYDYEKMKTNPITGQAIVPFKKEYSQHQIKHIASVAAEIPVGNSDLAKSARKHYQKILDNSEYLPQLEAMDNAYKSVYGKDAFISTPQQAAAAEAIMRASVPKEDAEEQEINYAQRQQAAVNKIYIQDGLIRGRKASISDNGVNFGDYDILGKYEKNKTTKKIIEKVEGSMFPKYEEKEIEIIPASDVDKTHKDMIGVSPIRDGNDTYYIVRANGDWEGANKQVISASVIAQKELDKVNLNELRRGRQTLNPAQNNPPKPGTKKGELD